MSQLTWRDRLELEPRWQEVSNWPPVDMYALSVKQRRTYQTRRSMIARALSGEPLGVIADAFGVSSSALSRLLDRALGGDASSSPMLSAACIPYTRATGHQRKSELPTLAQQAGCAGAFSALLGAAPALRETLDRAIERDYRGARDAQRLTPQNFHKLFIHALRKQRWPEDVYPFTQQSIAYESCRKYLHERRAELRDRKMLSNLERTRRWTPEADLPLSEVQIDEQLLDVNVSVDLLNERRIKRYRMTRVTLLLAIDTATRCVLGFHIAYTRHVNTDDMLSLLDAIFTPFPTAPRLSEGLELPPPPWFPNQLELDWRPMIGEFNMDNALSHHANAVTDAICNDLSASVHFGRPASPLSRHLVERVFHYINLNASHRIPSTTGSHPRDPKGEPKQHKKKPPAMTITQLEDIVLVALAEFNTKQRRQLDTRTPVEYFSQFVAEKSVFQVPTSVTESLNFFACTKKVRIKRSRTETRRPWLNVFGMRYVLDTAPDHDAIPDRALIRFDRRDIRSISAYDGKGRFCGQFRLPRSYQKTPISLSALRWILELDREQSRTRADGITAALNSLDQSTMNPRDATAVLRLISDTSGVPGSKHDDEYDARPTTPRPWSRRGRYGPWGDDSS